MDRTLRAPAGALALVVSIALSPTVARATTLTSEGGYTFDIQDGAGGSWSTDGSMSDGTSDAYDGCYYLDVNGTRYTAPGATLGLGGRQVEMPEMPVGALRVRRLIYVPTSGGDYARYLDVVSNPGATAATATITISGNLGSDGSTAVFATSSGDTIVTTADAWATTDDMDGAWDPSLGHVFQGTDPPTRATSASIVGDNISWGWTVSVPAGGRVAILTFAIMKPTQMAAQMEARRLVDLPDAALVGLDDYLDDVVNFGITVAGAPRVRFDGPYEIEEGDAATIMVTVTDPEGDPATWSWDLDGDGTFGEMPGATSYTVPAGTTDGPGEVRIGIEASDGRNVAQRYRAITVRNVAPTITNLPGNTVASVGATWRWRMEIDEPAGSFDPLTFTVARGPADMIVTDAGEVRWVPDELDVTIGTETVEVTIVANDGDEGTGEVSFSLTVSPNHPPGDVTLLYPAGGLVIADRQPRLVVSSVEDPDLDELTYFFEIDDDDTFETPLYDSGAGVPQTAGYTAWRLPSQLELGRVYHWRAWVSDGTVETEPRSTTFVVVPDPRDIPDGGPAADGGMMMIAPDAGGGGGERGGCAVAAPGGGRRASAALALLALATLAAVLRRRAR